MSWMYTLAFYALVAVALVEAQSQDLSKYVLPSVWPLSDEY